MPIAHVRDYSFIQGTALAATVNQTLTMTTGNLAVISIYWNNTAVSVLSVVGSGVTWNRAPNTVQQNASLGTGFSQEIWYGVIGTGGAISVTVTLTGSQASNYLSFYGAEFSGVDTIDQSNSQQGNAVPTSPAVVTLVADELLWGQMITSGGNGSVGAGWTLVASGFDTYYLSAYKIVSSTGSQQFTQTGGSQQYDGGIATFSLGAPPPPPSTAFSSIQTFWMG